MTSVGLSAEHTTLDSLPQRHARYGDKIEFIVGYTDTTTMLHGSCTGFATAVSVVWPIAGTRQAR